MKRLSHIILSLIIALTFLPSYARTNSPSWAVRIVESEIERNPEAWQLDFQPKLKWD